MSASLDLCVPCEAAGIDGVIAAFDRFGQETGLSGEALERTKLIVDELLTNVMAYGFPSGHDGADIRVRLGHRDGGLQLEVMDNGRPFDPTGVPPPDLALSLEERQPGGLGLYLMRSLARDIRYRHAQGFNILTVQVADT